jgi:hypothetical protein
MAASHAARLRAAKTTVNLAKCFISISFFKRFGLFDADTNIEGHGLRTCVDNLDHVIASLPELSSVRHVRSDQI